MADTTLHIAKPASKPSLEEQLRTLSKRTSEMEDVLRGAQGVLHSIHAGGLLDHLPRDQEHHADHSEWALDEEAHSERGRRDDREGQQHRRRSGIRPQRGRDAHEHHESAAQCGQSPGHVTTRRADDRGGELGDAVDVTQFIPVPTICLFPQPAGKAGAVTRSKFSVSVAFKTPVLNVLVTVPLVAPSLILNVSVMVEPQAIFGATVKVKFLLTTALPGASAP